MAVATHARRQRHWADVAIAGHEHTWCHPVVIEAGVELVVVAIRLHRRTGDQGAVLGFQYARDLGEPGGDAIPLDRARAKLSFPSIRRQRESDGKMSGVALW